MTSTQPYTLFSNRDILRLVIPLFIEQLLFMLVGTADTLMVAGFGAASISAVSLVDMFNGCLASIFFALATGGAVVVSQFIGARDLLQAREGARQLIGVVLVVGTLVAVVCECFMTGIIQLFYGNLADDVYDATVIYYRITMTAMPFIAVYSGCAALFRSMNKAKVTMVVSLIANLVNVVGNALLIYGFKLGVAGAAYATVFSRFLAMVMIFCLVINRSNQVYVDFRQWFRVSWKMVKRILYIGIPGGIENGVFQLGRVLVLGLVAVYGTREIAANAVANTVDYFSCIPGNAFALAVVTVIGQAVGAGNSMQVRYYVRKMMKYTYVAHIAWNVLLFVATPFILMGFSKIDGDTKDLAWKLILIHNGIGIALWPMSFVFPNILRSTNDVRFTMVASIGSMFVMRLGLSYLLARYLHSGVMAVWIAMIVDWITRITSFVLRYRSGMWTKLASYSDGDV